jgi:hypothetical protein
MGMGSAGAGGCWKGGGASPLCSIVRHLARPTDQSVSRELRPEQPSARESILKSEDLTTTGRATRLRAAARRREHGSQQEKRPTRIVEL